MTGSVRLLSIKDTCIGLDLGASAAAWFSEYLGLDCALVRIDEEYHRPVPDSEAEVGFADEYPLLGISEASLADLNSRMSAPLPMDRFRPNLVFAGCDPYAEDSMRIMSIGDVRIEGKKQCGRCKTTTIDQQTGEIGKEPLKTLATYRRVGGNAMFGMNFVHLDTGVIRVGDALKKI